MQLLGHKTMNALMRCSFLFKILFDQCFSLCINRENFQNELEIIIKEVSLLSGKIKLVPNN